MPSSLQMKVVLLLLFNEKKDINSKSDEILVSIKDTGTGIHHEVLPKLFTKFATKYMKVYWVRIIYFQEYN